MKEKQREIKKRKYAGSVAFTGGKIMHNGVEAKANKWLKKKIEQHDEWILELLTKLK